MRGRGAPSRGALRGDKPDRRPPERATRGQDGAVSVVPQPFAEMIGIREGEAGEAWVAALPGRVDALLGEWGLRVDGRTRFGYVGIVVPVRRADGSRAALKVSYPDEDSASEALTLAAWHGDGSVRLLDRDASGFVMLLEWLHPDRSLFAAPLDEGVAVLGGLLARLRQTTAPAEVPRLADAAKRWLATIPPRWSRHCGTADVRLRDAALSALRELGPVAGDSLLHGDLHYGNVLAGSREPWLVIDPKGMAGDPEYEVVPVLWNRVDELLTADDPRAAIRRRTDQLCEAAGLDRALAYRWALVRAVEDLLWRMDNDPAPHAPHLLIAEAMVD
jgi:streptomycin 6-kinase